MVGVVLALWAVASFVGVLAASLNTDTSTDSIMTAQDWADVRAQRAAITAEFDAWVLPPSIAADAVLERSAADDPIPYETRTYVPANGASADQAVADLQQMLLTRGWMYPYDEKLPWSARKAGLYATMQITIEAGKIVVRW